VVGTISRPMLSKSIVSDLQKAYITDKAISKDFESVELLTLKLASE
jgi:hypothetical protein